jgi:hypothetical protein
VFPSHRALEGIGQAVPCHKSNLTAFHFYGSGLESQSWGLNLPGPLKKILYVNFFTALEKGVQFPVDPVEINRKLVTRVLLVDEALLAEKIPGCFEPFGQTFITWPNIYNPNPPVFLAPEPLAPEAPTDQDHNLASSLDLDTVKMPGQAPAKPGPVHLAPGTLQ